MKIILNIMILVIFMSSNCNVVFANNNDNFWWGLTKDMTKAVASELVKSAVAEELKNDNSYHKHENEIDRLNNIIYTLRNNKEFKEEKIKKLEVNINRIQTLLHELKSGKTTQLQELKKEQIIGGRWFVILGSYKYKDYNKAITKKSMLEKKGFIGVEIFNTDNYPNLKNGLYIVNIGPLSKQYAFRVQNKLNTIIPDAYIKSGW